MCEAGIPPSGAVSVMGCSLTLQDAEEHQRQLRKKQKNRAAAQRSRQKHTNKADALHQQHESLEKQNHALRKEIQALQAELAWWTQALHVHERLCLLDCASCLAPGAAGCWGQAERTGLTPSLDPGSSLSTQASPLLLLGLPSWLTS
uniref:Basic leucine zipper transcriptional factor ATF-like 2 n=1 Tax=Bos mutus grunniens TaxID=30521 RepID=A0A8C0AM64_BOSMU